VLFLQYIAACRVGCECKFYPSSFFSPLR
jgi:hypothetical protein